MSCFGICAGDLKHKVKILYGVKTKDGMGGFEEVFYQKGFIFAKVQEKRGTENMQHQRKETRRLTEFTCRYRPDLRMGDILEFENWKYEITWINDIDKRKRWLKIEAERGIEPLERIEFNDYVIFHNDEPVYDQNGEVVTEGYFEPVRDNDQRIIRDENEQAVFIPEQNKTGV